MKKLLALMLAMVLVLSLAACGGDEEYEEPAEDEAYEEEAEYAEEDTEDQEYAEENDSQEESLEGADEPVSDEHFADLQESFAQLAELYNQVIELYNADEIAADETINQNLSDTKDIMDTMANISKDSLTEGDALKLMESMGYLAQALGMIVDNMEAA